MSEQYVEGESLCCPKCKAKLKIGYDANTEPFMDDEISKEDVLSCISITEVLEVKK